jgi:hypothetical protein
MCLLDAWLENARATKNVEMGLSLSGVNYFFVLPRRMTFVVFQLLLRQREYLFAHQRRHRDLNPVGAGSLMPANVETRQGFPLTERARDTLPGPLVSYGQPNSAVAPV